MYLINKINLFIWFYLIETPPGGGQPPRHPPSEDLSATVRGHRSPAIEGRRPMAWQNLGESRQDLGKILARSQQDFGVSTNPKGHNTFSLLPSENLEKILPEPFQIEAQDLQNRGRSLQEAIFKEHFN